MTNAQLTRLLIVIPLSLSHFSNATSQNHKWRLSKRLQVSYEWDNNIRENPYDSLRTIGAASMKFVLHSKARLSTKKYNMSLSYSGGLQSYLQHSFENKLINSIALSAAARLNQTTLGLRTDGRLKLYLNDLIDYASGSAELYLQAPFFGRLRQEFALGTFGLSYPNFSSFDYSGFEIKWKISKRFRKHFALSFGLSRRHIGYDRAAIELRAGSVVLRDTQEDRLHRFQFELNFVKSLLFNLRYGLYLNRSNSRGYGYDSHEIVMILGLPLPNGLWLRSYGTIRIRNYAEESLPFFPLDVDTEREESNVIIVDISKDVRPSLTTLLRFALYDNESIVRGQFYQKALVTVGLDFRF